MPKLFVDAGTTWSKVLELFDEAETSQNSLLQHVEKKYRLDNVNKTFKDKDGNIKECSVYLFPSGMLSKINANYDAATGHMVKKYLKADGHYENEVIALAYGAKKIISDWQNACIIDIGSRDIKWIKFKNGKYGDLDWNSSCGSVTGATVEMLSKFYNVNPDLLNLEKEKIPVTCGVFAMEKIMDLIANNVPADIAIARYIHGIAYNTWNFAHKPEKLFLSGGFCLNQCFIKSLELYCEVIPLGRHVLLEGLY